jgi:hypothetical protein
MSYRSIFLNKENGMWLLLEGHQFNQLAEFIYIIVSGDK